MKLVAVVLAGGAAERFGGGKLGVMLGGRPLLTYALDAAAASGGAIVVVTGTSPAAADIARAWASRMRTGVRIVAAEDPTEGMGASLRAGLAAVDSDSDGAFVFLGDMPFIPPDILPLLAAALARGAPAAAPMFGGVRGHPVLLGRGLIERRALISGDRGAGGLLANEPGLVLIKAACDGVLFDIDTPENLAAACARQACAPNQGDLRKDRSPARPAATSSSRRAHRAPTA